MNLRWSNGFDYAVEFEVLRAGDCEAAMVVAEQQFRRAPERHPHAWAIRETLRGAWLLTDHGCDLQSHAPWPTLDEARAELRRIAPGAPEPPVFRLGMPRSPPNRNAYQLAVSAAACPDQRLELHVEATPGHWTDPMLPFERPLDLAGDLGQLAATYGHVITSPRLAPDPEPWPVVRGTDRVLIVGPGRWHGEYVFRSCVFAIRHANSLSGFVADVLEAIDDQIPETGEEE